MNKDAKFLKKLLSKALANGYKNLALWIIYCHIDENYITTNAYYQLIFDVDFARAVWGDKDYYQGDIRGYSMPLWKYKLRKLVCKKDPLTYLKEEFHGLLVSI